MRAYAKINSKILQQNAQKSKLTEIESRAIRK